MSTRKERGEGRRDREKWKRGKDGRKVRTERGRKKGEKWNGRKERKEKIKGKNK